MIMRIFSLFAVLVVFFVSAASASASACDVSSALPDGGYYVWSDSGLGGYRFSVVDSGFSGSLKIGVGSWRSYDGRGVLVPLSSGDVFSVSSSVPFSVEVCMSSSDTFISVASHNFDAIAAVSYFLCLCFLLFSLVEDKLKFFVQFLVVLFLLFPIWFLNVGFFAVSVLFWCFFLFIFNFLRHRSRGGSL